MTHRKDQKWEKIKTFFSVISSSKTELTRINSNETFIDTKTPYISRLVEQKSGNRYDSSNNKNKAVVDVSVHKKAIN